MSALIVPVAEADPVLGAHRERYDPSAPLGVPAHVTVHFPFVDPGAITDETVGRLAVLVAEVDAFDCRFVSTGWFGDEVLWLAPEPSGPFRALTARVSAEFGRAPYGGAYDEVTPHLTVAQHRGSSTTAEELRLVEADVRRVLPLTTYVERVLLVAGTDSPSSWGTLAELPLAPTRAP